MTLSFNETINDGLMILSNFIDANKIVFIIMIAIIILAYLLINIGKKKKKPTVVFEKKHNDPLLLQNNANDISNKEELSNLVFNNLKEIKIAKMNFELEIIKNIVNKEIYELYIKQINTLKSKNQKNIIQNIKYINSHITNIITNKDSQIINFRITIECYDFIVDKYNKPIDDKYKNKYLQTYEIEIKIFNTTKNLTIEKLQLLYERKI